MTESVVKLSDIKDPVFRFQLREGEIKEVDPFEVMERIESSKSSELNVFDQIRSAFGLSTETPGGGVIGVISRHECLVLLQKLHEFIAELDVTKKLSGLTAKLLGSTTSSPPSGRS